jgi:hypothetical protein
MRGRNNFNSEIVSPVLSHSFESTIGPLCRVLLRLSGPSMGVNYLLMRLALSKSRAFKNVTGSSLEIIVIAYNAPY